MEITQILYNLLILSNFRFSQYLLISITPVHFFSYTKFNCCHTKSSILVSCQKGLKYFYSLCHTKTVIICTTLKEYCLYHTKKGYCPYHIEIVIKCHTHIVVQLYMCCTISRSTCQGQTRGVPSFRSRDQFI